MPLTQRFALRKLSVGVASVLLGTSIAMGINGEVAHADTTPDQSVTTNVPAVKTDADTSVATVTTSDNQANSNASTVAAKQIQATTPLADDAYTVTNVNASSEAGNGTDHTGRTNLAFDINVDIAHHDIKSGNYINVSMGIPYKLTANGQQYTLAYGGGASQTMPINVDYQTTSGDSKSAVIGYMRPVTDGERSYAVSHHDSPVANVNDITWEAGTNNNSLTANGNGGSNDSYQIIFNNGLEDIKAKYGEANLSLARMHFNLTWHNITGFDLDEAPLDTRYFHLYSSTATAPTVLVPQNDIQIGDRHFTSGLKIKVAAKSTVKDNLNSTVFPQSSSQYAAHTWYYNLNTKKWSFGDESLRYPEHIEAVGLSTQNDAGIKLGKNFSITVTKPAANDYVDYQFIGADNVKDDIAKNIVTAYRNYDLDPVDNAKDTFVTREMVSAKAPEITVSQTDSADGLTRTYHVTINGDYLGFKKDKGIGLINWQPKKLEGILPPEDIKNPDDDPIKTEGYYQGVTLRDPALQEFLEQHPWKLVVTNAQGQDLYNQQAGYYVQPYVYRNDVTSNSGILTGTINNVENHQVKETIHYVYKDTGKEAAPTYNAKLGFVRINQDGVWQDWTPAEDTFKAVTVPVVTGYHAVDNSGSSVKAVDAITVKHDSQDIDVTVYYVADQQLLTYTVIDDDTNQTLVNRKPLAEGLSNEAIPADITAKYQQIIKGYLDQGYYLVSAEELPKAFDNDTGINQNVTIHLAKKNHLQTEDHQVTRTITYYDKNTEQEITVDGVKPVKQMVKFTRMAIVSGATGKTVGYTLDKKQDANGNYVVEVSNENKAWQPASGEWAQVVNPVLTKYGYGLAEDQAGEVYATVAADQPTATTKDQNVKVFYPEQALTTPEKETTTRTINYRYANGPQKGKTAAPSVKQTVTFTRNKSVNQVTKKTTYTDWTSDHNSFAKVQSPAIKYYVPSQQEIAALTVKPGDKDIDVTVDYKTAPNAVTYTVIDDTNGKTLVDHHFLVSGFADEQLPASAPTDYQNVADHYQQLGYTIVSQEKLPGAFTHQDQNVTIHILMKNALQAERQTTTRTITYYDHDTGKQIMIDGVTDPVMQQATFTRQAIVAGPQKQVIGYTMDSKQDKNGNYLIEVSLDDADQAWQLTNGGWPASPNPDLSYYGYEPARNIDGKDYPVVAAGHPTALTPSESIKVYYQARITPSTEQANAERIIHYVYANGPKQGMTAAPDVHQVVTFSRPVETNEVTKQVKYGDWFATASTTTQNGKDITASDPTSFAEVVSPTIDGYVADQLKVNSALADRGHQPIEVTVNYTTEPHQITYTVIDDVTGLTLINHHQLGTGFADDHVPARISADYADVATHYQQLGYQLVSQDQMPSAFADHDLNLVIHLTHGTKQVSDQHVVDEEVKYQFVDGGTAAPTYQAAPITFSRTGSTDLVTGKTTWQAWTPESASFTPVISPVIDGYSTDTAQIGSQLVTPDSQDLQFIVLYSRKNITPYPTPEVPDQPINPVTPVVPVTPEIPTSSADSNSASTPDSSTVPASSAPVVPENPATPATSASDVPTTPAQPVTPHESTTTDDVPVSGSAVPASPVETKTTSEQLQSATPIQTKNVENTTAVKGNTSSSKKLPQTGNEHRSIWQVIVGAFLGLFGFVIGKKRRVKQIKKVPYAINAQDAF